MNQTVWGIRLMLVFLFSALFLDVGPCSATAELADRILEDFHDRDEHGFPAGWKAQRSETKAKENYSIKSDDGTAFLSARSADQRVYKKIAWDPKATPIVTWRWRLKTAPAGADPLAAVFVSLDTDLMVIPVATKYVWSATKPVGTIAEGGVFDASEIVLRSGAQPIGSHHR